jgi:hypothetical protein
MGLWIGVAVVFCAFFIALVMSWMRAASDADDQTEQWVQEFRERSNAKNHQG